MSNSVSGTIKPVPVISPNMQFFNSGVFGVTMGPKAVTPQQVITQSWTPTPGPVVFTATTPSNVTAISRQMWIAWTFNVQITATAGPSGNVVDIGVFEAPRAFPASQCCSNINVQLNSQGLTLNLNYVINAFTRMNMDNEDLSMRLAGCPSKLDQYQEYNDGYVVTAYTNPQHQFVSQLRGTVSDPLQSGGESVMDYFMNRGAWPCQITPVAPTTGNNVGSGNTGTIIVTFTSIEPLWLSPFLAGTRDDFALIGVNQLNITWNMGDMTLAWSKNAQNPDSSVYTTPPVVTLNSNPILYLTYLTPSAAVIVPPIAVYPYTSVDTYQTTIQDFLPTNPPKQVTCNNINLTAVPKRIAVWVTRSPSSRAYTKTDTFARIISASVLFDNVTGMLANASEFQLWQESVKNGLTISWTQWQQSVGSILILDPGSNIALSNIEDAPGVAVNKQLQITLTVQNIDFNAPTPVAPAIVDQYTMWVAVFTPGVLTITNGTSLTQTTVLTPADVVRTVESGERTSQLRPMDYMGGKFPHIGKFIKSGFNKAVGWAQKNKAVSKALQIANTLGYTPHESLQIAATAHGMGYGGRGFQGGASISHQELGKRARMEEEECDDDDDGSYE